MNAVIGRRETLIKDISDTQYTNSDCWKSKYKEFFPTSKLIENIQKKSNLHGMQMIMVF